jgi:hypothetical protein
MKLFRFAILVVVVWGQIGCTAIKLQDTGEWVGRSVRDLELHPEFSKMPFRIAFRPNGTELRTYADHVELVQCSAPRVSIYSGRVGLEPQGSNCTNASVDCFHRFTLDTGKIVAYELQGSCAEKQTLRPR